MVLDGLVLQNTFNDLGRGISGHDLSDVTIRNLEVKHFYTAIFLMNGLSSVTIEYSSLHDTTATHSIYLGSRERPNSNLTVRGNLARWTGEAGDAARARDQLAALLPARERVSGLEHPDTLADRADLARWTGKAGNAAGARDQYAALLPVIERVYGLEHPYTLTTRDNLTHWTSEASSGPGSGLN